MGHKGLFGMRRQHNELVFRSLPVLFQEGLCQQQDVFAPFPKRGYMHLHYTEPEKRDLAEIDPALWLVQDRCWLLQGPVCSRESTPSPHPFDDSLLEKPQDFHLQGKRHLPDFVRNKVPQSHTPPCPFAVDARP